MNNKKLNQKTFERGTTDKKVTYCMILFIWNVQNRQIYRQKIDLCLLRSEGVLLGENGKWLLTGTEFPLRVMKMF